jgi:hypothetical protein
MTSKAKAKAKAKAICGLAVGDSDNIYDEEHYLKKISSIPYLEARCKSYKAVPSMGAPCPKNPDDVAGWMKHFANKYRTRSDCTRRIKKRKGLRGSNDTLYTRRNRCYSKHCSDLFVKKKNGSRKRCLQCSKEEKAITDWDKQWAAATR